MNIASIFTKLKSDSGSRSILPTDIGIEQKGNLVYIYSGSAKTNQKVTRLAKSKDGLNFEFFKDNKQSSVKVVKVPAYFKEALSPRAGAFDNNPITIENVIKLASKYFVYYHVNVGPSSFRTGYAIYDLNKRLLERSDAPVWESPETWMGKEVTFMALIYHNGTFVSYWNLENRQIYTVVYPSFKIRQSIITPISPKLIRIEKNPIISPKSEHAWESGQTFNPGVILLDNKFRFLYRAIGEDGMSRLGYAVSLDGLAIDDRLDNPVFTHNTKDDDGREYGIYSYYSGGSWGGSEDPRIVRVGNEDRVYMTYTACDKGLRIGFTSISVDDFINGRWNWKPPICISPPGQVHKNWAIFPEKINGHYAILHGITPKIAIEYFDNLDFKDGDGIKSSIDPQQIPPQSNSWDKRLRGVGSPPLKTDYGWLMFYHAMDYKVGVMLLDLEDPTKIICRSKAPVLESKEHYENSGFKPGIIYVSGAVIKDGTLYVYYGGADSYVCVATANLDQFLRELKQQQPVLLESSIISKIV